MGKKQIINTVAYIRVSSEEQVKHGYSLDAQKSRLIEYCKTNGYKLVDFYIDKGKTARSKLSSRKELLRLIEDAKTDKFNRIVFWKLDRWFRNVSDYYKIQEVLDQYHIDWECTDEEYSTTTSNGRLHLNIKLSIAQNESDQTSDRIKFAQQDMIKNKRAITGSHCLPLGYIVRGEKRDKRVIKDKEVEHIVSDMFNQFKTYGSVRSTLMYINDKYNLKILYDSMIRYFKSELYIGAYKGTEDYCEPYITKKEYLENQDRLKCNYRNNKKYDYIFSSIIKCYCCNYKMSGFTHKTSKPKYNKTYLYHAYRCNKSYNSHLCSNRSPIMESHLENWLINNIKEELNKHIINITEIKEKQYTKPIGNIQKLNKKMDRLNEMYLEGRISKNKYETEYEKINKDIIEVKSQTVEERDLSLYKELLDTDVEKLYNKLNNVSRHAFWAKYIDYIERGKDLNYIVHFK